MCFPYLSLLRGPVSVQGEAYAAVALVLVREADASSKGDLFFIIKKHTHFDFPHIMVKKKN